MSAQLRAHASTRHAARVHGRGLPRLTSSSNRRVQVRVASPTKPSAPAWSESAGTSYGGLNTVDGQKGSQYFTAEDSRPIILFDGQCNLCNGGVQFVLDWDKEGEYRFAALQSEPGQALLQRSGRQANDISSIALVTKEKHWVKSQAVLHIAQRLRLPLPAVASLLQVFPSFVRDAVYDQVSANRYNVFGESSECRLMQPGWKSRFLQ